MPAYIVDTRTETDTVTWTETVEERDPETGELISSEEVEHSDTSDSLVTDWDGPGTFYYKNDRTQALVLTATDDPSSNPAFETAADIEALIESGEWDLPGNAFEVISGACWAEAPPAPAEEEEPV